MRRFFVVHVPINVSPAAPQTKREGSIFHILSSNDLYTTSFDSAGFKCVRNFRDQIDPPLLILNGDTTMHVGYFAENELMVESASFLPEIVNVRYKNGRKRQCT